MAVGCTDGRRPGGSVPDLWVLVAHWGVGVKLLRRMLGALMIAGAVAGGIRLKGSGGVPPQRGGWRPLELPDER